MKAVRMTRHGKPDVLTVADVPTPSPGAGEALVRIEAASINPSDVKNVQGVMEQTTLPRTPGRDFAGVVEAGPTAWIGAEVWGTGGDTGFTRDGSHAEYILVPADQPAAQTVVARLRCGGGGRSEFHYCLERAG